MKSIKELMIQMLEQEIEKNKTWFEIESRKAPINPVEINQILDRIKTLEKELDNLKKTLF